jgi:hypothetical protein
VRGFRLVSKGQAKTGLALLVVGTWPTLKPVKLGSKKKYLV